MSRPLPDELAPDAPLPLDPAQRTIIDLPNANLFVNYNSDDDEFYGNGKRRQSKTARKAPTLAKPKNRQSKTAHKVPTLNKRGGKPKAKVHFLPEGIINN